MYNNATETTPAPSRAGQGQDQACPDGETRVERWNTCKVRYLGTHAPNNYRKERCLLETKPLERLCDGGCSHGARIKRSLQTSPH